MENILMENTRTASPNPDTESAGFTFTFDADELVRAEQFMPSSLETECGPLTSDPAIEAALEVYAEAHVRYEQAKRQYMELLDLCSETDRSRERNHPVMRHFEDAVNDADKPYWKALGALDDRLTACAVCMIAEALGLVYVTDPATVFEVCRIVIRGGAMWDGHGFTQGEPPTLTPKEKYREKYRRGEEQPPEPEG